MSPLLLRRLSDEKLGSRLASGEAAAFDELYRRYRHRLAAYGAQLLGDPAAGEDVAQSTLMRAYQALRRGTCPTYLRSWLYGIAHNAAIDQLGRRREGLAGFPPPASRQPEAGSGALVAAIASLPERQRQTYALRELRGLRVDEISEQLGLTHAQVEQSLFAARNRLAELLVFGERLDCVAVRRLASGSIDRSERRGLKTHLRSCAGCRTELGRRGIALSFLPLPSLGWLRGIGGGALAGGGATAAKVGTAVCVLGVAAAVPLTVVPGPPGSRPDRTTVSSVRPDPVPGAELARPTGSGDVSVATPSTPRALDPASRPRVHRPKPAPRPVPAWRAPSRPRDADDEPSERVPALSPGQSTPADRPGDSEPSAASEGSSDQERDGPQPPSSEDGPSSGEDRGSGESGSSSGGDSIVTSASSLSGPGDSGSSDGPGRSSGSGSSGESVGVSSSGDSTPGGDGTVARSVGTIGDPGPGPEGTASGSDGTSGDGSSVTASSSGGPG